MRVVFDTNVLMSTNPDCEEFVARLLKEFAEWDEPVFKIALDAEGRLRQEYEKQFYTLADIDPSERNSNLGELCSYFSRVSEPDANKITLVSGQMPRRDKKLLRKRGCGSRVEHSLFGVARKKPRETYLYLAEGLSLKVPRGYSSGIPSDVRSRLLSKNNHAREVLKTLIEDGPPPDTWQIVEKILAAIKGCGGEPLEGECHEFKSTHKCMKDEVLVDTGIISQNVFDDLPKTVCSMLNKRGGYIFLGIEEKPSFNVVGITWDKSEDANQTKIVSKLKDAIQNFPAHKVDHHIVKNIPVCVLPANKMLIVIHVRRKAQKDPFYRATGKEGKTKHENAVWLRCGSQVCLRPESR